MINTSQIIIFFLSFNFNSNPTINHHHKWLSIILHCFLTMDLHSSHSHAMQSTHRQILFGTHLITVSELTDAQKYLNKIYKIFKKMTIVLWQIQTPFTGFGSFDALCLIWPYTDIFTRIRVKCQRRYIFLSMLLNLI